MKNNLGKIHVYTGDGKGKTTAAFGLALRAAGAGFQVCLIQFLKAQDYSELKSLSCLPNITFKRFGQKSFINQVAGPKDIIEAKKALVWTKNILEEKKYQIIILDEIFLALFFKLIFLTEVIDLIKNKPTSVELILTGRKAPKEIIKLADYVTEMKEIKHPYKKGLLARRGIEN